jgi:hypothetical protein
MMSINCPRENGTKRCIVLVRASSYARALLRALPLHCSALTWTAGHSSCMSLRWNDGTSLPRKYRAPPRRQGILCTGCVTFVSPAKDAQVEPHLTTVWLVTSHQTERRRRSLPHTTLLQTTTTASLIPLQNL